MQRDCTVAFIHTEFNIKAIIKRRSTGVTCREGEEEGLDRNPKSISILFREAIERKVVGMASILYMPSFSFTSFVTLCTLCEAKNHHDRGVIIALYNPYMVN